MTATVSKASELFRAFWIINRFEALFAYNVGYLLIIAAIPDSLDAVADHGLELLIFFLAWLMMKAQASVADSLHDYEKDSTNPQKDYVPQSVDTLGEMNSYTLLTVQMIVSLGLWGYLAYTTGNVVFVAAGMASNFFGYTYSYPPRFKEQGVFNHFVTSSVDVTCVLLPGAILLTGGVEPRFFVIAAVLFLYSFAYHIMHQAGDTYYDRDADMTTFTQKTGVDGATLLSGVLTVTAAAIALATGYYLVGAALVLFAANFTRIYLQSREKCEQKQSDIVSSCFRISRCATVLNLTFAANIFLVSAL